MHNLENTSEHRTVLEQYLWLQISTENVVYEWCLLYRNINSPFPTDMIKANHLHQVDRKPELAETTHILV
jgi:hypothetical protein